MTALLVGTARGLFEVGEAEPAFPGREVVALAADGATRWAILDGTSVVRSDGDDEWRRVAALEDGGLTCLLPTPHGLLVGTAGARVLRLAGDALEPVASFDGAPGRDTWYTPWGGPPDTRSMALGADGTIYVNVHVGGILRSGDGGATWEPSIDVDADVHQVVVGADGTVLAPCAEGLAIGRDGGAEWEMATDGLHATYLRATAAVGDVVIVTASEGPAGRRSGVYRRLVEGAAPFERCVPGWFDGNIDTSWLDAGGERAAFVAPDGTVHRSDDGGRTWHVDAEGYHDPRCLLVA